MGSTISLPMPLRKRPFAPAGALVLLFLVASTRVLGGAQEEPPALGSRLQRIEEAFRRGDAGALRDSCPSNGKVRVDLKGLTGGPASYGAGQLQVVFDRIFDDHRTREFAFRKDDVSMSSPRTAFARGRWVRNRHPGAQETVEHLTFTLREEGGDWRIHEIRSSR